MNAEELRQLDEPALADYIWKRLRRESPLDPPLASRFGDEEPEQFLIHTAESSEGQSFRRRLLDAVIDNLRRWTEHRVTSSEPLPEDQISDEQLGSLAFLISELEARELVQPLYLAACSFLMDGASSPAALTFGQTHAVRTLAHLQNSSWLAPFWQGLWENGPRSLRGLVLFGWARADTEEAFSRLAELVDCADEVDLPDTVWSLLGPEGPGIQALAKGANLHGQSVKQAIHDALIAAEAEVTEFDIISGLSVIAGDFIWPDTAPPPTPQTIELPSWGSRVGEAA